MTFAFRRLTRIALRVGGVALAAAIAPAGTDAQTLLRFDFDTTAGWQLPPAPGAGTIDVAKTATGSAGLQATFDGGLGGTPLTSGRLAVSGTQKDLAKLTLSFSLAASAARPVGVKIESFDADKKPTGALTGTVYPAGKDFYQRFVLDLGRLTPAGAGKFNPADPFVAFSIDVVPGVATKEDPISVRVDNVHYAAAALYVSPSGSDASDGRSEQTAFATPQKAVDTALPGDIILLMDGTYTKPPQLEKAEAVVTFGSSGRPDAWITLKNYPGHAPVISSHGQRGIQIFKPADAAQPGLAYLEVRGLTVRGNGDTAREQYAEEIGKFSPNTNSVGIWVFARGAQLNHHIRLADNIVEYCTADGIYIDTIDRVFVENNHVRNNCWTTIGYAPAGLTVMKYVDFDLVDNVPKFLISGNYVYGNKLTVMNSPYGKDKAKTTFFNGNGILLDANAETAATSYLGRTLVQNNVVYNNGAGGIQMWGNHRMDLVNNTVYLNSTVLPWGQIGMERCRDVQLINNIIVAPGTAPLDSWFTNRPDKATNVRRAANVYFGGAKAPLAGSDDRIADPQFVLPSADAAVADFRLKTESPAIGAGTWDDVVPAADISGKPRPHNQAPAIGAFQP